MNARIVLVTLIHIGLSIFAASQEIATASRITEVTVYRNLAKETRNAAVKIPAGNSEIVITGVSTHMSDPSLQVALKGTATLLSATVRMNYFTEENSPKKNQKTEKLQDSIMQLQIQTRWIEEERSVYKGELDLLNALMVPGNSKDGYKASEMNELTEVYRTRTLELKKKLFDLGLKYESIERRLSDFSNQVMESGNLVSKPAKEIVLHLYSEESYDCQLLCSYLVANAGWTPAYDLQVKNTSQPVNMLYKARIHQNTGIDWKDVKLIVSNSNPGYNNNRPLMTPKYVEYVMYSFGEVDNSVSITNLYQAQRMDTLTQEWTLATPLDFTQNEDTDVYVEFESPTKQTIRADNKDYIVQMQTLIIPATYKYHAVPKLDPAAFLMARITDYGQYNLLAGEASVFYGDTYVGIVKINPQITSDTLLISLGRDERIVVKRVRVTDKSSRKLISGIQKDTYAYQTTIRNNKSTPIEIEILDQIPLSKRKEIVVKLMEKNGADYLEEYGKLTWNYTIKPNDSKKINLHYTIEYPEGKMVSEK